MGRTPRSHLPGAVFHLTARTQGHAPWFTDALRTRIVDYVAAAVGVSDARLIAYAVMSNHLHLVVRQGMWPLGRVMQPLLRRIAGLVQRTHGTEGHVFERRFNDRACLDPAYVRNAVVYVNLNAVRAGLVADPVAYRWTSHAAYQTCDAVPTAMRSVFAVESGLRLFAPRDGLGLEELRRAYRRYVGWRIRCDRHAAAEELGHAVGARPPPPPVRCGDLYWSHAFAPPLSGSGPADGLFPTPSRPDLGDIARQTLAEHAGGIDLERVRSRYKGRAVVEVRQAIVCRMSEYGHPGRAIARYLRVSDQCVSNILAAERGRRSRSL
jgi:REP element-mobilizing transposase RayT